MSHTTLKVSGLTCGHCAQHVTEELTELGISALNVDLNAGGVSTVTFESSEPFTDDTIREAIAEAGDYTVESIETK